MDADSDLGLLGGSGSREGGREQGARHTSHIELGAGASSDRQARPHTGRKEGVIKMNAVRHQMDHRWQQLARWLWGLTNER